MAEDEVDGHYSVNILTKEPVAVNMETNHCLSESSQNSDEEKQLVIAEETEHTENDSTNKVDKNPETSPRSPSKADKDVSSKQEPSLLANDLKLNEENKSKPSPSEKPRTADIFGKFEKGLKAFAAKLQSRERAKETKVSSPKLVTSSEAVASETSDKSKNESNNQGEQTSSYIEKKNSETNKISENETASSQCQNPIVETESFNQEPVENGKIDERKSEERITVIAVVEEQSSAVSQSQSETNCNERGKKSLTNGEKGIGVDECQKDVSEPESELVKASDSVDSGKTEEIVKALSEKPPDTVQSGANEISNGAAGVTPKEVKNWDQLGVKRCPNCIFMTDEEGVFNAHITTCTKKPLEGTTKKPSDGAVQFSYKPGEYSCNTCGLTWALKAEFEEHVVCHLQSESYICITCKRTFESRALLEKHAKNDHRKGESKFGLRGIKKGRRIVEELETKGVYKVSGRLTVPKTPRSEDTKQTAESPNPLGATCSKGPSSNLNPVTSVNQQVMKVPAFIPAAVSQPSLGGKSAELNKGPIQTILVCNTPIASCANSPGVTTGNQVLTNILPVAATSCTSSLIDSTKFRSAETSQTSSSSTTVISGSTSVSQQPGTPVVSLLQSPSQQAPKQSGIPLVPLLNITGQQAQPLPGIFGNVQTNLGLSQVANVTQSTKASTVSTAATTVSTVPSAATTVPASAPIAASGPTNSVKINEALSKVQAAVQKTMNQNVNSDSINYKFTEFNPNQPPRPRAQPVVTINSQPMMLIPVQSVYNNTGQRNILVPITPPGSVPQTGRPVLPSGLSTVAAAQTAVSAASSGFLQHVGSGGVTVPLSPTVRFPITNNVQVVASSSAPHLTSPVTNTVVNTQQRFLQPVQQGQQIQFIQGQLAPLQVGQTIQLVPGVVPQRAPAPVIAPKPPVTTPSTPAIPTTTSTSKATSAKPNSIKTPTGAQQEKSAPRKFLFRIKPDQGFLCEACKKFTHDENTFRRHIYDHFHRSGMVACKTCSPDSVSKKNYKNCDLVKDIVKSLLNSALAQKQKIESRSATKSSEPITISDDEEEETAKSSSDEAKQALDEGHAVIVVDNDFENENNGELQIKITSTYSLSSSADSAKFESLVPESPTDSVVSKQVDQATPLASKTLEQMEADNVSVRPETKESNEVETASVRPETQESNKDDLNSSEQSESNMDTEETPTITTGNAMTGVVETILTSDNPDIQAILDSGDSQAENSSSKIEQSKRPVVNEDGDQSKSLSKPPDNGEGLASLRLTVIQEEPKILSGAFYRCGFDRCSYYCMFSYRYKDHLTGQHPGAYTYTCFHCGLKNYTEESHMRHLLNHVTCKTFLLYSCPSRNCKYSTNLIKMYQLHIEKHHADEGTYKCQYCDMTFTSAEELVLHLKSSLLKYVSCPHCSFKYRLKQNVMNHIRMSHPDKPRIVTITSQIVCKERYMNGYTAKKALEEAKRTEHGIATQGPVASVATRTNVSEHVTTTASPSTSKEKAAEPASGIEKPSISQEKLNEQWKAAFAKKNKGIDMPKDLKCPHCSYLAYNQHFLNSHVKLHDDEPDRKKRFLCMYCPAGIDNLTKFKKHLMSHIGRHQMKTFYCTQCTFCTNLRCHIQDHLQDAHYGSAAYTEHTENVHSNEFSCKQCDFKSKQQEAIRAHEIYVHESNIARQDSQNDKGDSVKKTHKYHCSYCSESFKHKALLKHHMRSSHSGTDGKTFVTYKCKYCFYTSTKKDVIIKHLDKKHPGEELRILKKVEKVEDGPPLESSTQDEEEKEQSAENGEPGLLDAIEGYDGPKEKVPIPDGNIYKFPFQCPKCPYSNKIRINVMRHIKRHPELIPEREIPVAAAAPNPKRKISTARKSTSNSQFSRKPSVSSPTTVEIPEHILKAKNASPVVGKNPFKAIKETVKELDKAKNIETNAKAAEQYCLGGEVLHKKLSTCFFPQEKNISFKCRICKQIVSKKYVLHRHLLEHLGVVFFKCRHCEQGALEQEMLFAHIHKEHPLKSIEHDTVDVKTLDTKLNAKIASYNFSSEESDVEEDVIDEPDIDDFNNDGEEETPSFSAVNENLPEVEKIKVERREDGDDGKKDEFKFMCDKCNYTAKNMYFLNRHQESHLLSKKYGCFYCGYKTDFRGDVHRHIGHRHPGQPVEVKKFDKNQANENKESMRRDSIESRESVRSSSVESKVSKKSTSSSVASSSKQSSSSAVKETKGVYLSSKENKPVSQSTTKVTSKPTKPKTLKVSNAGVFEIKLMYKCKDCGEKRLSKGAMYDHFHRSRCHRQWFQCSYCAFQSHIKIAISKHSKLRHPGQKVSLNPLPLSGKIKTVKYPVKQNVDEEGKKDKSSMVNKEDRSAETGKQEVKPTDEQKFPKTHSCKICYSYKTDSIARLQFHLNSRHNGKSLVCLVCDYKSMWYKHMLNHCINKHDLPYAKYTVPEKKRNQSFTETKVKSPPTSSKMTKVKSPLPSGSSKKTTMSSTCVAPMDVSSSTEVRKFQCTKCSWSTNVSAKIKAHVAYVHFDFRSCACPYCDSLFINFANVRRHILSSHPGRELKHSRIKNEEIDSKVEKIYQKVIRRGLAKPAVRSAPMEEKQTKDDKPSKHEKSKSEKSKVDKAKTGIKEGTENIKTSADFYEKQLKKDSSGNFKCLFCYYSYVRRTRVRDHMEKHHAQRLHQRKRAFQLINSDVELPPAKRTKTESLKSETASIKKESTENASDSPLEVSGLNPTSFRVSFDMKTNQKFYECIQCDYKTPNKKALKNHSVCHGARNYKCWYCSYSSKLVNNAYRHIKNIHKGKPLRLVNLKYNREMEPKNPQNYRETQKPDTKPDVTRDKVSVEKPSAPQSSSSKPRFLKVSMLTYCCNICDYKIAGLYYFRQHLATHKKHFKYLTSGTEIESKLSCGFCSYMALDDVDFNLHITSHLDERPYKCGYCDFSAYSGANIRGHLSSSHEGLPEKVINKSELGKDTARKANPVMLVNVDPKVVLKHVSLPVRRKRRRPIITSDEEDETEDLKQMEDKNFVEDKHNVKPSEPISNVEHKEDKEDLASCSDNSRVNKVGKSNVEPSGNSGKTESQERKYEKEKISDKTKTSQGTKEEASETADNALQRIESQGFASTGEFEIISDASSDSFRDAFKNGNTVEKDTSEDVFGSSQEIIKNDEKASALGDSASESKGIVTEEGNRNVVREMEDDTIMDTSPGSGSLWKLI